MGAFVSKESKIFNFCKCLNMAMSVSMVPPLPFSILVMVALEMPALSASSC